MGSPRPAALGYPTTRSGTGTVRLHSDDEWKTMIQNRKGLPCHIMKGSEKNKHMERNARTIFSNKT